MAGKTHRSSRRNREASVRPPTGKMPDIALFTVAHRAIGAPRGNDKEVKMLTFLNNFSALVGDERGVTALEYGLIAGLVAVVIVGSVTALGTQLKTTFTTITAALP
jgi:pilus assembly protein Flp/PilA